MPIISRNVVTEAIDAAEAIVAGRDNQTKTIIDKTLPETPASPF